MWSPGSVVISRCSRLNHKGSTASISNFGALNCVKDLAPLGALAKRYVRPGGVVMLGLMARTCALEVLYFLATRRPDLASRRRGEGPVAVSVAGVEVPTFYHRIADVRTALGGDLSLDTVEGIGVAVPPPYLEPRWQALPQVGSRSGDAPRRTAGAVAAIQSRGRSRSAAFHKGEPCPCMTCSSGRRTTCGSTPSCGDAQQPYAPLGTLYAASQLRAAGLSVALFDAMLAADESRVGRGARPSEAAICCYLRGQLQLPHQDVPAADAPGSHPHDRARAVREAAK